MAALRFPAWKLLQKSNQIDRESNMQNLTSQARSMPIADDMVQLNWIASEYKW